MGMACGKKVQEPVTNTKVNTNLTKSMAMVYFHGLLEIFTKATMMRI